MTIRYTIILLYAALLMALGMPIAAVEDLKDSSKATVFVLGVEHLAPHQFNFYPALLNKTIERLKRLKPDSIAAEYLPPQHIEQSLQAYRAAQSCGLDRTKTLKCPKLWQERIFFSRAIRMQQYLHRAKLTGTTNPKIAAMLRDISAYDTKNAALKWSRLNGQERAFVKESYRPLYSLMLKQEGEANEVFSIGVRLAHELGHTELHGVDFHNLNKGYDLYNYIEGYAAIKTVNTPLIVERNQRLKEGFVSGNLLPFLKWINDPKIQMELQGLSFYSDKKTDPEMVRLWDERNEKIVEHILKIATDRANQRVLVIIGDAHKAAVEEGLRRSGTVVLGAVF